MRSRCLTTVGVLLVTVLAACSSDQSEKVDAAARTFLDAWAAGKFDEAAAATDAPGGPADWLPAVQKQLDGAKVRFDLGDGSTEDEKARREVAVSWALPGVEKPWSYGTTLNLVKQGDAWKVHWDTTVVHPELAPVNKLVSERTLPERAPILDRAGQPIFTKQAVVTVGIEPGKAADLNRLATTLSGVLAAEKITAAAIVADAQKAKPTDFVPVVTLRQARYLEVKPKIYSLPGTVFRRSDRLLPETPAFGQPLLGRVGEATAEVIKETGGAYAAGDQLGTSGMQRAFNRQLTGEPSVTVNLTDQAGKPVKELFSTGGKPGEALRTTIDRGAQKAAEAALAAVPQQAAIVVIKPSSGEILAAANSASVDFNIALEGKYPPGSTFKIITTTAVLQSGVAPTSTVACPGELTAGGKKFINADRFDLGVVPLRTAFAQSCNTSMITLGAKLPPDGLTKAATQYGIGAGWKLGVASYSGAVPPPVDATEAAADAIGQGKVLVSPFSMALAAATVQRGSVPNPVLVTGKPATPQTALTPISPAVLGALRGFSRAVVTDGTAKAALRGTPGPVAGKTGTAEYGQAKPPRSHSWFAGYRGDLAFAVFVFDGASSGKVAAPVAAQFLAQVPR